MEGWQYAVLAGGMALLGLAGGYWFQIWLTKRQVGEVALNLETELARVETKQREIVAEARQQAIEFRQEVEAELRERGNEVRQGERRLQQREETIERCVEKMDRRDEEMRRVKDGLDRRGAELDRSKEKQDKTLGEIAQLSRESAREIVLERVQSEVSEDTAKIIYLAEQEAKGEADRKARWLVGLSLQRVAADHAVEATVSAVPLPGDDMKGRIIGREGRNIRALEAATGVDLIIDDTPETVVLSSFDPVRREVARTALTRLIKDGRIHPARIEETVAKARRDVNTVIKEEGERAAFDVGVPNLHPEIINLLGRLRFRQSYGQNVLGHSIEVAYLGATMAGEMGGDPAMCRIAGLLHDIGKAIDHDVEGPHALIGAERAKRYGISQPVVNAIAAHHFDEDPETFEAFAIAAADAISAARPGARRETVDLFIKRMQTLEDIANSFEGVEKSYAIQAGREVRIAVRPDDIDELGTLRLSRNISRKIQDTMAYPGQIKVTVIRETRSVGYAR